MNPRDFLDQAERLANEGDAAGCRSAISRAYYAAYNVGCQHCAVWEVVLPTSGDGHEALRDLIQRSREPELTKLSKPLHKLRWLRNRADYHLDSPADGKHDPEDQSTVRGALGMARRVIATLDAFAARPEAEREPAIRRIRDATRRRSEQKSGKNSPPATS